MYISNNSRLHGSARIHVNKERQSTGHSCDISINSDTENGENFI